MRDSCFSLGKLCRRSLGLGVPSPSHSLQVLINSFNYTNESNQRLGTALYLGASMLDHSCLPNAAFSFRKGRISVRALENIDLGKDRRPQDVITIR